MEKKRTVGIILAAGRGTRINAHGINKTALPFLGKPMIQYGVDLLLPLVDRVIIVIGTYSNSVREALKAYGNLDYAYQRKRLGTGHAVKVTLPILKTYSPSEVLVGYGDHLMFNRRETVKKLINFHRRGRSVISLLTTRHDHPDELAWGRIQRGHRGQVLGIIEQKDATLEERQIDELNPGFYCFNYKFLCQYLRRIKKSKVTNEYYLTDLIKLAVDNKLKVSAFTVPFSEVGIGINRAEELLSSEKLYKNFKV